jgi:rubrerythrin
MSKTEENLKAAFAGESQARNMYTFFAKAARKEGNKEAAMLFKMIARVEAEHRDRYKKLLEMVENGTVYTRKEPIRWRCSVCGYIHEGTEPPVKCPCCKHPREYYEPESMEF